MSEELAEQEDTQKDRYLTFRLGEEDYGFDIGDIIEIIGMQKITQVPSLPPYIKGVINLRGQGIPVMDMRIRFHLPARDYDQRTCIIVTEVAGQTMGMVVDRVNEVIDIPESQVEPAASRSTTTVDNFVKGLGKIGTEIKILLDIHRFLETTA